MSPFQRALAVAAGAVALVALFVALRGRGDDGSSPPPAPPPPPASTAPVTPPPPPAPTASGPATVRATLVVRAGGVSGPKLVRVEEGDSLVLVVRSDVTDEVHLHGYDRSADVAPGFPATLRLKATVTGRFDVELEHRGLRIGEVEVR